LVDHIRLELARILQVLPADRIPVALVDKPPAERTLLEEKHPAERTLLEEGSLQVLAEQGIQLEVDKLLALQLDSHP
jgi:hypothetical protein